MNAPDHLASDRPESSAEISLWHQFRTTPWIDLLRARLSCRLDVAALVGASDLPDAGRRRILDIVKRTRLWRIEKVNVAGELIAHFADGLEAGASLDDLLESFGDVRTTAKLVRRAKVRCRPWSWHVTKYLRRALVCLIVFYIGAIFYYAMGSPNIAVDYVARMNESTLATPEENRAWPLYRQALLSLDREPLKALTERGGVLPGDPTWGEAVKLVQASQPALENARLAAAKPHLGYVRSTKIHKEDRELWPDQYEQTNSGDPSGDLEIPTINLRLPFVNDLRYVGGLLAWDALLAAERGDGDRVVEDIEAILGMARQMSPPETPLVEQLVKVVITHKAIEALGIVLRDEPACLTDEHIRHLAHRLAAQDVAPIISLKGERFFFYDVCQHLYTDDGHGDGHLVPNAAGILGKLDGDHSVMEALGGDGALFLAPAVNAIVVSRKELTAKYEQYLDSAADGFQRPYWERLPSPIYEWLDSLSTIERTRYGLLLHILPALHSVYTAQQSAVGRRDGLLIALALEMYRRRHVNYPKSLDALSPRLLPSVPRDRFTGSRMLYRVDGDRAVIYCVGQDRDDDGGVVPANVPKRFLEIPEGASQYVIDHYRKHNERLRNETPYERRQCIDKAVSPSGSGGKHAADGDWVLWHSAEWPVERDNVTPE